MNRVALAGCTIQPLGSYLKALAVLRLVSEQADADARGWWEAGCFHLDSALDEGALVEFFLERYRPTPIVAPWNGGSGFYPKDRKIGLGAIAGTSGERFSSYRDTIAAASKVAQAEKGASKNDEDERRAGILRACRNGLPDACVDWLDAAVSLSAEGKRAFAPILGTGGNEGRLDYTNNFMENVAALLVDPDKKTPVRGLLGNSLFGDATDGLGDSPAGQYDPGHLSSNAWNLVLTLEGAVAWAGGVYRKQGVSYRSYLCSPFTVAASPVGYGSAAEKDRTLARAEIWTPVWTRPAPYPELRALLREGRAAVESKPARTGIEFAQAACTLGVDRGIRGFMRYSLLKRRGESYIALPAGHFGVQFRRETDLVREIQPLLDIADRSFKKPPAAYASLRRQVDEAIYNVLLRGGADALREVAATFGRLHQWLALTGRGPYLPARLSANWIEQCGERAEVRIAAALASIWDREAGSLRDNLTQTNRQFAWTGRDLAERLASVLVRRIMTSEAEGAARNPVGGRYAARAGDATLFVEGSLDDDLIEALLFAFTLIQWQQQPIVRDRGKDDVETWPVYALLKHLFLPRNLETPEGRRRLPSDLTVVAHLKANRVAEAADLTVRRLRMAGLAPLGVEYKGGLDGRRLAAALMIPVPYGRAFSSPVLNENNYEEKNR